MKAITGRSLCRFFARRVPQPKREQSVNESLDESSCVKLREVHHPGDILELFKVFVRLLVQDAIED
jgi:hypothetical protein